jgi:hypothetical protein
MQSKRWTIFNLKLYKNEILIYSDKNNNLPLVGSSVVILLHKLHAHLQFFSDNPLAGKIFISY